MRLDLLAQLIFKCGDLAQQIVNSLIHDGPRQASLHSST
jgi:hypothetical protein